jgi:phosphopentomutase
MYRKGMAGKDLGTRETFADISATVLDFLGLADDRPAGKSLLQ